MTGYELKLCELSAYCHCYLLRQYLPLVSPLLWVLLTRFGGIFGFLGVPEGGAGFLGVPEGGAGFLSVLKGGADT